MSVIVCVRVCAWSLACTDQRFFFNDDGTRRDGERSPQTTSLPSDVLYCYSIVLSEQTHFIFFWLKNLQIKSIPPYTGTRGDLI